MRLTQRWRSALRSRSPIRAPAILAAAVSWSSTSPRPAKTLQLIIVKPRRQQRPRRCFWTPKVKLTQKNPATLPCPSALRGTVAGLALAHAKYGSGNLPLAELVAPAITLARNGVEIVDDIAETLPLAQARISRWPSSAPVFLNSDGTVLMPGQDLLQPDLAITL